MSAARAVEQPTPAATPLTAATTGLGQPVTARTIRLAASSARTSNRSWASSPEMSAPALNAGPVPVRTTTLTASLDPASSSRSASATESSPLKALNTAGRLKVSQRAPSPRSSTRRSSVSSNVDARLPHRGQCCLRGLRRHTGAEGEEHGRLEPFPRRVERRGPDAVVGRDAADVDPRDVVGAEPVGERLSVVGALEAGVRRLVLALEEDRVEGLRVEVGVERLALGADPAVHRPRLDEVGFAGSVIAG